MDAHNFHRGLLFNIHRLHNADMSAQAVPRYERCKMPVNNKEPYLSIRGLSSHSALSSYMGKGIEIVLVPQARVAKRQKVL
jgi:hypothetical protein